MQLLDVTREDSMRTQSVEFCYSDDENDDEKDNHSVDSNSNLVTSNNQVQNDTFFSPIGKIDAFLLPSFPTANAAEKPTYADISSKAARARQVHACGDDPENSPPRLDESREADTPDQYGSLRIPALDRGGESLDLSNEEEERHRVLMERILADQGEAEDILTRHCEDLAESEPTPRAWLHTIPTPPSFVSPVRAQQLEDAMNTAIEQVEKTLIDFEE